ncbi:MAG: PocR ligand-binding domain-containing protein [bacterium]|nr:PocR ligand-binding domain-containing protein [bacterium]
MNIRDFIKAEELEELLQTWSKSTGMACGIVDDKGERITGEIGYTDFCIKYTRGCEEGQRRCTKCDQEGKGIYTCHAGLMEFRKEIIVDGNYLGKLFCGQILTEEPDEEKYRAIARELGINEDDYIEALKRVNISSAERIEASVKLLEIIVIQSITKAYYNYIEKDEAEKIAEDIEMTVQYIHNINSYTKDLDKLEKNQKILALNASIESARAGEAGKGFAIVATKVGSLAADFGACNHQIKEELERLTQAVSEITGQKM